MTTQSVSKWAIDPTHSEIGFKAKHLMITTVSGKFEKFQGEVETNGDDFHNAKINFSADVASITTGSEQRDGHLKGADFFQMEKYPQLTFTGSSFDKIKGNEFKLKGNLTINDVTKPIELQVEYSGTAKDPWGNTKAGFIVDGKLNRKDWGLNWNVALEAGGMLVSDEIKIHCEVQFAKQA